MAASWFYMHDNKRKGPASIEQLRRMAADGRLRREDSVWTVGMNQWTPAGQVPAVFAPSAAGSEQSTPAPAAPAAPAPAVTHAAATMNGRPIAAATAYDVASAFVPAAAPAPAAGTATMSYYGGGLPPRALETLKGHAPPTGDRHDWPLDDARVEQFAAALKVRKKVTGAANLYRALLLLLIVIVVFAVFGAAVGLAGSGGNVLAVPMLVGVVFFGALCALYYFAARATMRAQRWAPLTMMILFLLGAAVYLFGVAAGAATDKIENMIGATIVIVLGGLFALVSWTSFAAMPKWRSQPAWCQELIVKSGQ